MTADVSAAERAYLRLKDDIQYARLPAGPLDIKRLGDRLRMSATPVREALARLSAQQLVYLAPNHGYAVVFPSAHRLAHLYQLNGLLLGFCLAGPDPPASRGAQKAGPTSGSDYASRATDVFNLIASRHPNLELQLRISEMNDRLFAVRLYEPDVLPEAEPELAELRDLWTRNKLPDLRALVKRHHAARARRSVDLAHRLAEAAERTR